MISGALKCSIRGASAATCRSAVSNLPWRERRNAEAEVPTSGWTGASGAGPSSLSFRMALEMIAVSEERPLNEAANSLAHSRRKCLARGPEDHTLHSVAGVRGVPPSDSKDAEREEVPCVEKVPSSAAEVHAAGSPMAVPVSSSEIGGSISEIKAYRPPCSAESVYCERWQQRPGSCCAVGLAAATRHQDVTPRPHPSRVLLAASDQPY
eukprot:scaffold4326_cov60-Phaeocystis_antarctica.AAC.5